MLSKDELKTWLHKKGLGRTDKLLLVLATFEEPCQVRDITVRAGDAGFRVPKSWNVSTVLLRTDGQAIRTSAGWELAESGKQRLLELRVGMLEVGAAQVAVDLRAALAKIADSDTRAFVEEAIKCYEHQLHRSAIVMSWLSAVDVLQGEVHAKHLKAFNAEAKRVDNKWKDAKTTDDLGRMSEADFLDRIAAISVVGKNVKKELKDCLDQRNGCGHPNSLKIGRNTVAHHIEILILNVFEPFS